MEKDCEAKPDFVAVDFEHATSEKATICSVGIVLFKDGEIIEKFHSFVQPPENKYELTWLHKIHPRLTENAPSFVEIFPEIYKRLNNNTVVAHGAFHTDKVCLDNAIILHNI
jgi:DNA polymerase-3 subunit epsilon